MHAASRILFAFTVAALGVENVLVARYGDVVVPVLPWIPAHHPFWACLMGLVLITLAGGILANARAWLAAVSLGSLLLAYMLVRQVWGLVEHPLDVSVRTGVFEVLAIAGAALTLASTLPARGNAVDKLTGAGRFLFAFAMVVFGIDHFIVLDFVASLVPAWIPGGGLFWTCLTGAGFIAAGLSFATKWMAQWAGILLAAMFFLWFALLHAPRIAQAPRSHDPNEWSSAFIALAMCGGGLIMASAISRATPAARET
jgi:hypothetical protein